MTESNYSQKMTDTLFKNFDLSDFPNYLKNSNLKYIYMYKKHGIAHEKLGIALRECGFNIVEIRNMTLEEIFEIKS